MARGGKRPGAGRPAGVPNKITKEVKEIAQEFGEEAVGTLVSIMRSGEFPPAARVAASKEILDRAYGKSVQHTELTGKDGSPVFSPMSEASLDALARKMKDQTDALDKEF
jgi:hypothetical protein